MLGVVGESESDKSTLARALLGVWRPLAGEIRLDSAEIQALAPQARPGLIGYLPQDCALLAGTVAENIARFARGVSDAMVIEAAQRADPHDLILHLPAGHETALGDGGLGLSGGKRLRVALARALFGDTALLVLDEPNSALDAVGEAALPPQLRLAKLPEAAPPVVAAAPEQPPSPPLGPRLVAAVGAGQGAPTNFVATYDPRTQQILLVPAAALRDVPRGQVPELWLVPPDGGAPVLLGTIDPSRAHTVDVPERFVPHAQSGAGLLVTLQSRGAQPAPAGRTLARGRFSEL